MAMLKKNLLRIYFFLSEQIGINPLKALTSARSLPHYLYDFFRVRRLYKGKIIINPCLCDRFNEAGSNGNEYFKQDLLVAQKVFVDNPANHVDVGSRIDGFVAHVASFRSIEVIDIRNSRRNIPGVVFTQANMMSSEIVKIMDVDEQGYCDSISCLHAIEHFGLGRYGDPLNPLGYQLGIQNLSKLLSMGGILYLSTPIGDERIEFNANWVFNPKTIIDSAKSAGLALSELIVIDQRGEHELVSDLSDERIRTLSEHEYHLGLFVFVKTNSQ
jgi:hypothetical protein